MAYPSVTALPAAPSRVGDPDNFASESTGFFSALPTWRTQSNALESYIDSAPLNIWNWGTIADSNPTYATLATVAARPTTPGLAWASDQDVLLASLYSVSTGQNAVGAFIDAISALTGSFSDPDRPLAVAMEVAPTRGLSQSAFNSVSATFYNSTSSYQINLNIVAAYFNIAISPDDYGTIGEAITFTDDWGTL